ncbi:protein O-glucosyltransferase 3-like isoform X2 [Convolutriloba macropyga]|uniref:protein O-glucosyltransferase 3-like isoform X2 n=1 Tax=Convolutriloba macropyga TaxID=536237 RepID=UPI003F51CB63
MCLFYYSLIILLNLLSLQWAKVTLVPTQKLGLDDNCRLPVRFVEFAAVDNVTRERLNSTVGTVSFKLAPIDSSNGRPRYRPETLDMKDGSYIIRWRLVVSFQHQLRLTVVLNEEEAFSHTYPDGMLAEECNCPFEDPNLWTNAIACPAASKFNQIHLDFHTFPSIPLERLAFEIPDRFNKSHAMIHYTIISNQLYRRQYGKHGDFKKFSDDILLSLLRKVKLPDTEFVINLGDWPGEKRQHHQSPIPILTWGGSMDTRDISLPTWDITKKTYSALQQESMDVQTMAAAQLTLWKDKIEKAFFRGRDSRKERLELVRLSKRHPNIIDAGLTNYFFFRKGEEEELGKAERVSMLKFHDYKYQISIDGTVAAYRLPFLLAGNSVVLKHDSDYYEHFYSQLEPWRHYIPYNRNLSDLVGKLEWAKKNDVTVEQIAKNGREFVLKNLSPNLIYCYYYRVLETYTSRQYGTPQMHDRMEQVTQPEHSCDCEKMNANIRDHRKQNQNSKMEL